MSSIQKVRKWCNFEFDENEPQKKNIKNPKQSENMLLEEKVAISKIEKSDYGHGTVNINDKNWMKTFDPVIVEDLAIHNKKIQEVEEWLKSCAGKNQSDILLMTGPVGSGKTITISILAAKHNIKVTEWITPLDIDMPSDYGDYEFKEKQSTKFLEFIIKAANFTSLLDNNDRKLVIVEDFPNTFIRTPSEFTDVLQQYKYRAKSPIVFICSETHSDTKNTALNLFTPSLKEQFHIHHIIYKIFIQTILWIKYIQKLRFLKYFGIYQLILRIFLNTFPTQIIKRFNSISTTGLKFALKRVSEIISKKHKAVYNVPTADMIDCVVNSSAGDVRSAVLNLHFACLKGSNMDLETSIVIEKETKSKTKKKKNSSKFLSLGKDQTVNILHGVGRVLNPKVAFTEKGKQLTHSPKDVIEQFLSQPSSFVNFLEENYLPHFSCSDHTDKAASALSDADFMLAEWREKMCQEYGLYTAVAGIMLANKAPISAWNPVRGPKNMKVQYPSPQELRLDVNYLYKGKVLVMDYQTYSKIIGCNSSELNNISIHL